MNIRYLEKKIPKSIKMPLKYIYSYIPLKFRYAKVFWNNYHFLKKVEFWNKKKIKEWQLKRLKEIIYYSYKNIPGYYFLFKEFGCNPRDINSLKDIKSLPFVTKELIRDNLKCFTSRTISKWKLNYVTTGGSSGIPLGFYHTSTNAHVETAFIFSGWERAGWKLGDRSAVLRGAFVGSKDRFWEFNPARNELLLSTYYLSEETYNKYVGKILEYHPMHLQAYPSAATIFSDLILENNKTSKIKFKTILLGSENIYEWQKELLSKTFPNARLFGWYGHAEQVILAPMCEYSNHYHVWPFYGFTEILNEKGKEIDEEDVGELVGTSFFNYATPFIRYRTMDMAKKGRSACERCGRQFQLLERIEGRLHEIILTKTGRYISMAAINMHSDVFDNVKQFQFSQDTQGRVVLKVVRKDTYTKKDSSKIRLELKKKLGEDMELEIVFVDVIPKTQQGKYRFLDQKLVVKYGE